tara:strand:+ start:454 stop:888 length:435 start_codon:yes stop_codon:yes gene_type:complete
MIKKMFQTLTKSFHRATILTLSFITTITLLGYPAFAAKSNMTGDYTKDTVSVVKTLKEVIDTPKDAPNKEEVREEALSVITDYISRYRNRGMVNTTQSFTTMQTALNAMAGHYKNFATRPLPDNLKERLNKELSIAEKMVLRES